MKTPSKTLTTGGEVWVPLSEYESLEEIHATQKRSLQYYQNEQIKDREIIRAAVELKLKAQHERDEAISARESADKIKDEFIRQCDGAYRLRDEAQAALHKQMESSKLPSAGNQEMIELYEMTRDATNEQLCKLDYAGGKGAADHATMSLLHNLIAIYDRILAKLKAKQPTKITFRYGIPHEDLQPAQPLTATINLDTAGMEAAVERAIKSKHEWEAAPTWGGWAVQWSNQETPIGTIIASRFLDTEETAAKATAAMLNGETA